MIEAEEAKKKVGPWAIIAEVGSSRLRATKLAAPLVRLSAIAALMPRRIQKLLGRFATDPVREAVALPKIGIEPAHLGEMRMRWSLG